MSFILIDLTDRSHAMQCNGWNWRPTLEIIRRSALVSIEQIDRMRAQGCGGQLTADQAKAVASFIEAEILPQLKDDEMMHHDGTISPQPKQPRSITQTPAADLYAARKSWLISFVEFCRSCSGFEVV